MIAALAFYQLLATASFTLLGLWFVVVGLSHGGWRTDPVRHRYDLHVALHFLLPGATGLAAVLAGGEPLFWRVAALLSAIAGLAESLGFLAAPGFPRALPGRFLRALDPLLYAGVGVAAVTSPARPGADADRGRGHRARLPHGNGLPVARLRRAPAPCPPPPGSQPHLRSDHDRLPRPARPRAVPGW